MLHRHQGNFEAIISLSTECIEDLLWWVTYTHMVTCHVERSKLEFFVTSDSSDYAWGGTRDGTLTGGPWNVEEQSWHINVKELLAAYLTLQTFCAQEWGVHIRLKIDNTTSVAYINKKGGKRRDLNEIARQIWLWAQARNIWLSAEHLPGACNVEADTASRKQYACEMEWQLSSQVFEVINKKFGPFTLDLFATRLNAQCNKYFAWKPDPHACAIDAFAQIWDDHLIYGFPPFSMIGRTLKKVEEDRTQVTLILPLWPTQVWFGRLLGMLIDLPWLLPRQTSLLQLPQALHQQHPFLRKLRLTLFRVSGRPSEAKDFHNKLSTLLAEPGEDLLRPSTTHTYRDGLTFAVEGKQISCKHLQC